MRPVTYIFFIFTLFLNADLAQSETDTSQNAAISKPEQKDNAPAPDTDSHTSNQKDEDISDSADTTNPPFHCDVSKRTCSAMTSCEEAIFYWKECGQKQLDRDQDGRPCESLCGRA